MCHVPFVSPLSPPLILTIVFVTLVDHHFWRPFFWPPQATLFGSLARCVSTFLAIFLGRRQRLRSCFGGSGHSIPGSSPSPSEPLQQSSRRGSLCRLLIGNSTDLCPQPPKGRKTPFFGDPIGLCNIFRKYAIPFFTHVSVSESDFYISIKVLTCARHSWRPCSGPRPYSPECILCLIRGILTKPKVSIQIHNENRLGSSHLDVGHLQGSTMHAFF